MQPFHPRLTTPHFAAN